MEAAGAIVGFIGFPLALFQSCLQAFEILKAAQHTVEDVDVFAASLEWEQYQLLQWGTKAGLDSPSPSEERINWQLAERILRQLEVQLTSAEKLKTKYRLDVVEEDIKRLGEGGIYARPTRIDKWITTLKPELMIMKNQMISKNSRVLKRLQWATMGKDQADAIIQDIAELVSRLYRLLDSIDREKRARVDEVLMRDILSRSSTASEVDQIEQLLNSTTFYDVGTLQAAARLKQIRLIIGSDTREDEVKTQITKQTKDTMPRIRKLKHKKLSPYLPSGHLTYEGMEIASYDHTPVLVEWKMVPSELWKEWQQEVQCLAAMLASPSGRECRSLLCIGYLPWEERELYALVYDMPDETVPEDWSLTTLASLISREQHISLASRFEIARTMAKAVLQLHTAGWLHKSLRSDNIVYLAPKSASDSEILRSDPYLIGYGFARADSATAAALTQLPDTEPRNDLYRHPKARGLQRETYRKRFDLYSLGCILLELGMWQPVHQIATTFLDADLEEKMRNANISYSGVDAPSFLQVRERQSLLESLRHAAGDAFVDAFTSAIFAVPNEKERFDVSLDAQQTVLSELEKCKC